MRILANRSSRRARGRQHEDPRVAKFQPQTRHFRIRRHNNSHNRGSHIPLSIKSNRRSSEGIGIHIQKQDAHINNTGYTHLRCCRSNTEPHSIHIRYMRKYNRNIHSAGCLTQLNTCQSSSAFSMYHVLYTGAFIKILFPRICTATPTAMRTRGAGASSFGPLELPGGCCVRLCWLPP